MTTLSVPDMTCGHCKATVETALGKVADAGLITVDLATRQVKTDGQAQPAALLAALDAAGYPAAVLAN